MHTTSSHCHRRSFLATLSYFLCFTDLAAGRVPAPAKEVAKMVDALANHNVPPKIVGRRKGQPAQLPLFPKDYDWKEDDRVVVAVGKLYEDTTSELWEELVKRVNDARYCLTTWDSGEDAVIRSVGYFCKLLAYSRLSDGFNRHLPSLPPHGCPIRLDSIIKDLPKWRMERKDKPLYQLQIEACETVIHEIPKIDAQTLSDAEKAAAHKDIEVEIKQLRRTKKPISTESSGFIPRYTRGLAKEIRKIIESGSNEEIQLEK